MIKRAGGISTIMPQSENQLQTIGNQTWQSFDPNLSVAASQIHSPTTGQDHLQALSNQATAAMAMQNTAQAVQQIADLTNPVAPAAGVTIPTMGGNLSIAQTQDGYLKIGDMPTHIPMQEFKGYMHQHPEAANNFANMLAHSGYNNNNISSYDFGKAFEKTDNGTVENLLSTMSYFTQVSTKDTQVGMGSMLDSNERMIELLEEIAESKQEKNDLKL